MIYLFKNDKTLYTDYPIISEDVILSMPERRQINGLWTVSAELLVEGIYEHVNNSEFIGFYDIDDKFQLYKIIDLQVNNDVFIVDAVYLFHDEAYSGEVIRDRRFRDRQADAAAIAAFEPIGWELDGYDFTDERTTNFFYISPLEALARIEEVWGVEFNFWLVFDGQKILGKYYEVRKQIGVRSNRIYEYNENISSVTHTQSRQDIVTAILPRGRGEELEEGVFGRSIQIDDVVWSTENGDPLNKPAGQDYLEIPEMTELWGYEGVKPRIRKVDFSQEEDPENLIQLAYEWLLENCVPKVIFKLSIDDGAGHKLGDIVGVSYKEINLTSYTRIFEVEHDHRTGATIVEFGDVELKSDRRISSIRSDIDRIESNNSRVVELQQQFNSMFDAKVQDMEQEYDQALIDAQAEIQAAEQRMADLIGQAREDFDTEFIADIERIEREAAEEYNRIRDKIESDISNTRSEMESEFEAEVVRIEQEALAEYNRISGEITSSIGQARTEIEQDYSQAVQDARKYADSEILAKEQQYVEDWNIRDAQIQSTIEQIVGGSVDNLDSSLLEIDSNLLEINTKLLDKLEIEDISDLYADVDVITENLNTAREDLDTARADLDTTRDDLNSTRDDLQAKLDDAKAEFDSLEIGGRNLAFETADSQEATTTSVRLRYWINNEVLSRNIGNKITLSFEAKFDVDKSFTIYILELPRSYAVNSTPIQGGTTEWKKFTVTSVINAEALENTDNQFTLATSNYGAVRNLKVELGTVATDWTPAPEDVESKITTIEQDIQYIDGELSAKLTQTDIEPFVNRISEAETNITVSATEISTLQNLTEVLDEDITTWSNLSQSTADEVSTLLTRVSDTEDGLTVAEASISATADEVITLLTRVSDTEDGLSIAEADISTTADGLSALITRTSDVEGEVSQLDTDLSVTAEGLSALVTRTEATESGLSQAQADISVNADAITARVTRTEFDELVYENRNLLLNSDFKNGSNNWIIYYDENAVFTENYVVLHNESPTEENGFYQSVFSPRGNIDRDDDEVVTVSVWLKGSGVLYVEFGSSSGQGNVIDHVPFNSDDIIKISGSATDTGNGNLLFGLMGEGSAEIHHVKLEKGTIATDWTPSPRDTDAKITQLATELTIEAGLIEATMSRVDDAETAIGTFQATADGLSAQFGQYQTDLDDTVQALTAQVASYEFAVDGFRSEVGEIEEDVLREFTLIDQKFDSITSQVSNINTWHYNLLRGTRFDEDKWNPIYGTIRTDEEVNYFYFDPNATGANTINVNSIEPVQLTEGEQYTLSWDFQSFGVLQFGNIWLLATEDDGGGNISIHHPDNHDVSNLTIHLGQEYRRYWIRFTAPRDMEANVRIGVNLSNNPNGRVPFKIRLPYLTTTDRSQWLYHQLDNTQTLDEIVNRISTIEQTADTIRAEVTSLTSDTDDLLNWRAEKGTIFEQTADAITAKVWQQDIHNPNMLSYTDITLVEHRRKWSGVNTNVTGLTYGEFMRIRNTNSLVTISVDSSDVELVSGEVYTLSWVGFTTDDSVDDAMGYSYVLYPGNSNQSILPSSGTRTVVPTNPGTYGGNTMYKYTRTFTARHTGKAQIRIGGYTASSGIDASFAFKEPKLELGNRATPYYSPYSALESRTDFILRSDGFLLGGTYVGGEHYSTAIIGDADGLKLLGDTIIDGNLYVKERIESYAVSAVEGDFARIFASNINAITIDAEMITTGTMSAERIRVNHAFVNRIMAQSVFANEVEAITGNFVDVNAGNIVTSGLSANIITSGMIQSSNATIDKIFSNNARIDRLFTKTHFVDQLQAKSLDAIDANIGRVRTSFLTANLIESSHIESSNATINKLFSNNARIDTLVSKTHFVDKIHAMSISAVNADIANIRTNLLTADVIESGHIKTSNAMINKLFANNAQITTLTSKTAFVNSIKAIEIDVEKITGNTSNFVSSNWNAINSNLEVTGARLRYTHSDGSYTQMSAAGLRKFDNNSWYTTHYLMDSINVQANTGGGGVVWVQLPNVYKGKQFKIFLSATDIFGAVQESDYYFNHLTLKRFVLIKSPDHNIDYTNARVPIRGYAHYVDDRDKEKNALFYPLQGVLTVIY